MTEDEMVGCHHRFKGHGFGWTLGVGDAIQPSHPLSSPFPHAFNLSQYRSFPKSWLSTSGGQSIGASASASVLPMNNQDRFPLGLTGLINSHAIIQ